MIFYFSGTGNTRWAAQLLAEAIGEELRYIPDELGKTEPYQLKDGERLGFCFPTHGWQPPHIVREFIRKGAEKIGTMADLPLDRYSNKGVALECLISERNGIEFRGKDNIGFWVEGDLTINGISYQIKFNGAQIVSEGTLHTLKRFQKLGLELPKSINRGTNGKLDKIEAERKIAA